MAHHILEKNGITYYSESYLQDAIEGAYRGGLFNHIQTSVCMVVDPDDMPGGAASVVDKIREIVERQFQEDFVYGRVWRKGSEPAYRERNVASAPMW